MNSFDEKKAHIFVWPWIKGSRINAIKSSQTKKWLAAAYDNGALQIYDYSKEKALKL